MADVIATVKTIDDKSGGVLSKFNSYDQNKPGCPTYQEITSWKSNFETYNFKLSVGGSYAYNQLVKLKDISFEPIESEKYTLYLHYFSLNFHQMTSYEINQYLNLNWTVDILANKATSTNLSSYSSYFNIDKGYGSQYNAQIYLIETDKIILDTFTGSITNEFKNFIDMFSNDGGNNYTKIIEKNISLPTSNYTVANSASSYVHVIPDNRFNNTTYSYCESSCQLYDNNNGNYGLYIQIDFYK